MTGPMMHGWNRFLEVVEKGAAAGVLVAGETLVTEIDEILGPTPARTGRIYPRRSVRHQASAPGEAPAPDQGFLKGSIASVPLGRFATRVGSSASYAAALEFGSVRFKAVHELRMMGLSSQLRRAKGFRRLIVAGDLVRERKRLQQARVLRPRPFMRPAFERARDKMTAAFVEESRIVTLRALGF